MWQNKKLRLATIGVASLGVAYLAYALYKDNKKQIKLSERKDSEHSN